MQRQRFAHTIRPKNTDECTGRQLQVQVPNQSAAVDAHGQADAFDGRIHFLQPRRFQSEPRILRAKRTPRGKRGLRVIVVVACSVLASAARLCWIIVVVIRFFCTSSDYYSYCVASSGFDFWVQMSNMPPPVRTFFCAHLIHSNTRAILYKNK